MIPPDQYFRQTVSLCFVNGCGAVHHKKRNGDDGTATTTASYVDSVFENADSKSRPTCPLIQVTHTPVIQVNIFTVPLPQAVSQGAQEGLQERRQVPRPVDQGGGLGINLTAASTSSSARAITVPACRPRQEDFHNTKGSSSRNVLALRTVRQTERRQVLHQRG